MSRKELPRCQVVTLAVANVFKGLRKPGAGCDITNFSALQALWASALRRPPASRSTFLEHPPPVASITGKHDNSFLRTVQESLTGLNAGIHLEPAVLRG